MATATLLFDPPAGQCIEWYRDDDNDSGLGDNPQVVRWYGSTQQCRERILQPPPTTGWRAPEWTPSPHAGEWF